MTCVYRALYWLPAAAATLSLSACLTTNPLTGQSSSTEVSQEETTTGTAGTATAAPPLTPAEKQLQEDEKRFYSTLMGGAVVGALVGAGAGALGCHLMRQKDANYRKCVAASTVTGGLLGGVDGYVTAKREAAGRNEVRALQATIADVKQDNDRLKSFLDSSKRVLAEGRARLAALRADLQKRKVTAAQAEEARQREERNIASMQKTLEQAKESRANYASASGKLSGDKRDLNAEIKRMDAQIKELENNVAEYNRALTVSRA